MMKNLSDVDIAIYLAEASDRTQVKLDLFGGGNSSIVVDRTLILRKFSEERVEEAIKASRIVK
jgi:hypothetical protein